MHVKRVAVLSVGGLLLIGAAGDLAWAQAPPPFDFFSVSPCRLLDTRLAGQGPALASGVPRLVTVTGGSCGIPAIAGAIAVNITAVGSTGAGNLRLYPGDGTDSQTSAINFVAGQTRANNGVFPLAGTPTGTLTILATVTGGGTVHAVLDVTGYFAVPPCVTPASCPGVDTDCQTRTCINGVCGFSFQPAGTPTSSQIPGDCHRNECDGAGGIHPAVDNADLPNDGQQCTDDVCIAGTPSHPPSPAGTACSQDGGVLCDGQGACVQCLVPSDCPGVDSTCQTRTCNANLCGVNLAPAGTPCTENGGTYCDGSGNCVP